MCEGERDGARRGSHAELVDLTKTQGATDASIIPSREIVLKDELAALCVEPRCPNYGLAASCPPHVAGPAGFQELVARHPWALVFKIDVPSKLLLSPEVVELMCLVHDLGTTVERRALELGLGEANAFGGGSCKTLFCHEEPDCAVVDRHEECRHPDRSRPSMSGFGVDTTALLRSAGWTLNRVEPGKEPAPDSQGTVCGLVLLG